MVHDRDRDDAEAAAKKLDAEAKKILAETKKFEAETARMETERGTDQDVPRSSGEPRGERKAPMERPSMDEGVTEGDWSFFLAEWERYCDAVGFRSDASGAVRHLWSACSESLRRALHNDGAREETSVTALLGRIKSLAVKRRNNLVNVMTMQGMSQDREEGVHAFLARLNGQADLCDLAVVCPQPGCQKEVSFKDKFKMLQFVWGLYSKDIQEKVLAAGAALGEGQEMSLHDVLKMVEEMEMGKQTQALVSRAGGACRLSEHQRNKYQGKVNKNANKSGGSGAVQDNKPCGFCGWGSHSREKCPAKSATCHNCKNKGHFQEKCRSKNSRKTGNNVAGIEAGNSVEPAAAVVSTIQGVDDFSQEENEFFGDCFNLHMVEADGTDDGVVGPWDPTGWTKPTHLGQIAQVRVQGVKHMRCRKDGRWTVGGVESHGKVQLSLSLCTSAYGILDPPRVPPKSTKRLVPVLADTGAQMCVTGVRVALQLGVRAGDLVPCELRINGANNSGLDIVGAMFLTLEKEGWKTNQMVYVARGVQPGVVSPVDP